MNIIEQENELGQNSMKNPESLHIPLFVDLDGTFIKTDMLYESFILAMKQQPLIIIKCIFWLLKGRLYLKNKLCQLTELDSTHLPLNRSFYNFLVTQKKHRRQIILATASTEKHAIEICNKFDIFDSYISSDQQINLKGKAKLNKIQSMTDKFAYAGNSSEDYEVFAEADECYLVNPTSSARKRASTVNFKSTFEDEKSLWKTWLKQFRLHQWLKNILIFVPLLVSGSFLRLDLYWLTIIGFLSFSCLASATYIINDLLDLDSDRAHQSKKNRPLAASNISISHGIFASIALFAVAFTLASFLSINYLYTLLGYLGLTLVYSLKIKKYVGMDVIALASLYTIRILAGSAIISVTASFWLFSFSMFIFLSLALVKRCAELNALKTNHKQEVIGRDYTTTDYNVMMSFGTSSSLLAVLMFCFYTNSGILTNQYQDPDILWLIIPALCYWLIRMWIKTERGEMHDDPIIFSLKDKGSLITIGFIVIVTLVAQFS